MSIGLKYYLENNKRNSLKWKIKNLKWELRYAWRRAWYGYDDLDVFQMYYNFIERYKVVLQRYRTHNIGLFNVPIEYRDVFNKIHFNEEETNAIIDTMIYHLEMMDEDHVEKVLYGKNVHDDESVEEYVERYTLDKMKRVSSVINQNKEAFMKLFNIFFWDLWY